MKLDPLDPPLPNFSFGSRRWVESTNPFSTTFQSLQFLATFIMAQRFLVDSPVQCYCHGHMFIGIESTFVPPCSDHQCQTQHNNTSTPIFCLLEILLSDHRDRIHVWQNWWSGIKVRPKNTQNISTRWSTLLGQSGHSFSAPKVCFLKCTPSNRLSPAKATLLTANACAAKASLASIRSRSLGFQPTCCTTTEQLRETQNLVRVHVVHHVSAVFVHGWFPTKYRNRADVLSFVFFDQGIRKEKRICFSIFFLNKIEIWRSLGQILSAVSPCFTMFHHVSPCFTMFNLKLGSPKHRNEL